MRRVCPMACWALTVLDLIFREDVMKINLRLNWFYLILGLSVTGSFAHAQTMSGDQAPMSVTDIEQPAAPGQSDDVDNDFAESDDIDDTDERDETHDENAQGVAEAELEQYAPMGRRVYLICIYGPRDKGEVTRKCRRVEKELNKAYGSRWVTRLNNPTEERLRRIQDRIGRDIAVVMVVTHSTPDATSDSGYDVWDCEMELTTLQISLIPNGFGTVVTPWGFASG